MNCDFKKLGRTIPESQNKIEKKPANAFVRILLRTILELFIYVAISFFAVMSGFMLFGFKTAPVWQNISFGAFWLIIYLVSSFKLSKGRFYSVAAIIIGYVMYIAQYVPAWRNGGIGDNDLTIFLGLAKNELWPLYIIAIIFFGTIVSCIYNIIKEVRKKLIEKNGVDNVPLVSKVESQIRTTPNIEIIKSKKSILSSKLVRTILLFLVFCIALFVAPKLVILYQDTKVAIEINTQDKGNNGERLADMASAICNDKYSTIYTDKEYQWQGIFECEHDNYIYYINAYNEQSRSTGNYKTGEMYEIGYVYHEKIEEIFPTGIYIYRESHISGMPSELKIAVEANDEQDFIDKYAKKFYDLIKLLNEKYKSDLTLAVYFNKTLDGIESTYDKLFLNTQATTMHSVSIGNSFGGYTFEVGSPTALLQTIFSDKGKYPSNARSALKFNRHVEIIIKDGQSVGLEDFYQRFKDSFQDKI